MTEQKQKRITKEIKKQRVKELFMTPHPDNPSRPKYSLQQITDITKKDFPPKGIAPSTIQDWKKKYKWEEERRSILKQAVTEQLTGKVDDTPTESEYKRVTMTTLKDMISDDIEICNKYKQAINEVMDLKSKKDSIPYQKLQLIMSDYKATVERVYKHLDIDNKLAENQENVTIIFPSED